MKRLMVLSALVMFSLNSFAQVESGNGPGNNLTSSTKKLIESCREVGIAKVVSQAKSYNLKVNPKNVKVCDVDNRLTNPSKYVWFCAVTTGGEKEIQVLTQKSIFRDCF